MSFTSELIPAVGSLLGNIFNNSAARDQQARDFNYQTRLMDKANEYNHPVNQVSRLKAAGINPLAVMGDAGQSSTPSAPSGSQSINNPLQEMYERRFQEYQLKNIKKDYELKEATKENIAQRTAYQAAAGRLASLRASVEAQTLKYWLEHGRPPTQNVYTTIYNQLEGILKGIATEHNNLYNPGMNLPSSD